MATTLLKERKLVPAGAMAANNQAQKQNQTLREFGQSVGMGVDYNPNTREVRIGGLTFKTGEGSQYGISYDPNTGAHSVSSADTLRQALGLPALGASQQPQQAPTPTFDGTQALKDLFASSREAAIASIENKFQTQINNAERQRAGLAPLFKEERADVDAEAVKGSRRLSEIMAAKGIGAGGEMVGAQTGLELARQQAFSGIGQRETQAHSGIDQQIRDLQDMSAAEQQAAIMGMDADMRKALFDEMIRQQEWQYRAGRDQVGDTQWQQQFGLSQDQADASNRQWTDSFEYQKERDAVADTQWEKQFNLQKNQPASVPKPDANEGYAMLVKDIDGLLMEPDYNRRNQQVRQFLIENQYSIISILGESKWNAILKRCQEAGVNTMNLYPEASGDAQLVDQEKAGFWNNLFGGLKEFVFGKPRDEEDEKKKKQGITGSTGNNE